MVFFLSDKYSNKCKLEKKIIKVILDFCLFILLIILQLK